MNNYFKVLGFSTALGLTGCATQDSVYTRNLNYAQEQINMGRTAVETYKPTSLIPVGRLCSFNPETGEIYHFNNQGDSIKFIGIHNFCSAASKSNNARMYNAIVTGNRWDIRGIKRNKKDLEIMVNVAKKQLCWFIENNKKVLKGIR